MRLRKVIFKILCPIGFRDFVLWSSQESGMGEPIDLQCELTAAKAGDHEALGRLLDHFRTQLRESIRADVQGPLQRRLDESDIIQQACVRAMQAFAEQFRGSSIGEFWGWLRTIQQNAVVDAVRHNNAKKRNAHQEQSAGDPGAYAGHVTSPSEKAIQSERRRRLQDAIATLPDEQRIAIHLRHIEEQKIADIAAVLGKSEDATAKIILRGMSKLKDILRQQSGGHS